jgi:hypothetical protein
MTKDKFVEDNPKAFRVLSIPKPGTKTNAQELTREYLLEFYNLVMSHPSIMKHITDEIHITARAKAGGQLHGQKEAGQTMPEMKANSDNKIHVAFINDK